MGGRGPSRAGSGRRAPGPPSRGLTTTGPGPGRAGRSPGRTARRPGPPAPAAGRPGGAGRPWPGGRGWGGPGRSGGRRPGGRRRGSGGPGARPPPASARPSRPAPRRSAPPRWPACRPRACRATGPGCRARRPRPAWSGRHGHPAPAPAGPRRSPRRPARRPGSRLAGPDRGEREHGVAGGDADQLLLGRVGRNAVEEDAHLGLPLLEVGPQDGDLLVALHLGGLPLLPALADQGGQPAAGGPGVADPLALAPGRDQVVAVVEREQVDRRPAGLAALAALDLEHPAAPDADAVAGEEGDAPVEDVLGEPAGLAIVGLGGGGGVAHGFLPVVVANVVSHHHAANVVS